MDEDETVHVVIVGELSRPFDRALIVRSLLEAGVDVAHVELASHGDEVRVISRG